MSADRSEIPLIDLAPYFAGELLDKRRVAAEIGRACERTGFFLVTNHGVEHALCERASRVTRTFFDLPLAEKLTVAQRPDDPASRGYEPVGTEVLSATIGKLTPPDLKESFSLGPLDPPADPSYHSGAAAAHYAENLWPSQPALFRTVIEDYVRAMERLSLDLHHLMALALELPADYFEDKLDKPFSLLRVLNYPEQRDEPEEEQLRAGEHSDYDNLTICLTEDKPGSLQARGLDGAWIDVPAVAGSFVINIGDLMMRWTNDRWRSTRHRVVNPPAQVGGSRRQSLCYFVEPNYDAPIECLPTCHGPDKPAKYPPITAGDYMIEKFAAQTKGEGWSDEQRLKFGTGDTETRFES